MCDFKPGDEVTPITDVWEDADRRWWMFWRPATNRYLFKGSVYVVADMRLGAAPDDPTLELWIKLAGHGDKGWFTACSFRKVQRRDLTAWLSTSVGNTDALDKPIRAPKRERVS